MIEKCRTIVRPELKAQHDADSFYVLAVDVARFDGDQSVIMVLKVITGSDHYRVKVVNIKLLNDTHFEEQAKMLKRMDIEYGAKAIVIDINGIGGGLADFMILEQNGVLGERYPAYSFVNKTKYATTEKRNGIRKLYGIEATRALNGHMYNNAHLMLSTRRVRLLMSEGQARRYFSRYKTWSKMGLVKQSTKLIPYATTTKLQDQLANLKANIDSASAGAPVVVTRINSHMRKDLVSAFVMGLAYIRELEEKDIAKRNRGGKKAYSFYN